MYSSFMAAIVLSAAAAAAAITAAEWLCSFSSRMPMMLEMRKGRAATTAAALADDKELWPEKI